jgi:hypothetical protein
MSSCEAGSSTIFAPCFCSGKLYGDGSNRPILVQTALSFHIPAVLIQELHGIAASFSS